MKLPWVGITWGPLTKAAGNLAPPGSQITGVGSGRHACYDRLLIDANGSFTGYSVTYVTTVRTDAGFPVAVRGGARLEVLVMANPAYDINTGQPTYARQIRAN